MADDSDPPVLPDDKHSDPLTTNKVGLVHFLAEAKRNFERGKNTSAQPASHDGANYGRNFENYARNFANYARNFENYARGFGPVHPGEDTAMPLDAENQATGKLPNGKELPSIDDLIERD